jgi:hypothetical protein
MSFARLSTLVFLSCASFLTCAASTVGTCQPDRHSYSTIAAAITAAQNEGVIEVCPGVYPEQLVIKKPVQLRGIGTFSVGDRPGGLQSLAELGMGSFDTWAAVVIDVPRGYVSITNMTTDPGIIDFPGTPTLSSVCQDAVISPAFGGSYAGIYSLSGTVVLDHIQTGVNLSPFPPGTVNDGAEFSNCGDGIMFKGGQGIVLHSAVTFGHFGISGASKVEHSIVSGGGAKSIGITAQEVIDSTVTGPGFFYSDTSGIGSRYAKGNVVQGWVNGMISARAQHNTLLNNEVALSGASEIVENLIVAPSSYANPACNNESPCSIQIPGSPAPTLPTVGVDMGCVGEIVTRDNSVVGVGIGFENVASKRSISSSNLLANVTTTSTACAK